MASLSASLRPPPSGASSGTASTASFNGIAKRWRAKAGSAVGLRSPQAFAADSRRTQSGDPRFRFVATARSGVAGATTSQSSLPGPPSPPACVAGCEDELDAGVAAAPVLALSHSPGPPEPGPLECVTGCVGELDAGAWAAPALASAVDAALPEGIWRAPS